MHQRDLAKNDFSCCQTRCNKSFGSAFLLVQHSGKEGPELIQFHIPSYLSGASFLGKLTLLCIIPVVAHGKRYCLPCNSAIGRQRHCHAECKPIIGLPTYWCLNCERGCLKVTENEECLVCANPCEATKANDVKLGRRRKVLKRRQRKEVSETEGSEEEQSD